MVSSDIRNFLAAAAARHVHFHLQDGRLVSRAPTGSISESMVDFIKEHRAGIVECIASGFTLPMDASAAALTPREGSGRLSLAQERFLFLSQFTDSGSLYNIPMAVAIRGELDPDLAERALQSIVDRHAPLRTVYRTGVDGSGTQHARADSRFILQRIDCTGLPPTERQARLEQAMHENASWNFELSQDLMIRGAHVRMGENESVLLLCAHHIATDGWSFQVIEREFSALYVAYARDLPDPLPPLRISYSDYIEWQRDRLATGAADIDLAYWGRQLADVPASHGVPLDHPRQARHDRPGARHGFMLDPALHRQLRELAMTSGSTIFMVLHAAFALLLSRYSRCDDIVMGTPVLNRLDQQLEALVGCFVNTLVLRVSCAGASSFGDFLRHVKAVNLDAQSHQEITFEQVVDHMNPRRSALHSPLFQIMFSMGMPQLAPAPRSHHMDIVQLDHVGTTAKFDLSLYAQEIAGEMYFGVEYDSSLFDASTIVSIDSNYRTLLSLIATHPDASLDEIASKLATKGDGFLEGPRIDEPRVALHRAFEAQARQHPNAYAVVFGDRSLSYGELDARASKLARALRGHGVGAGHCVGIYMPRSIELTVALLAVWKAGAAYVPLDPAWPTARIRAMVEDAGIHIVINDGHPVPGLAEAVPTWVSVDAEAISDIVEDEGAGSLDDLAYVIFTSGSTGRPKGVMIEHGSLANLRIGLRERLRDVGVNGACRWAWNASPSFDASLQALLQWAEGGTLYLLPDAMRRDPDTLVDYLASHRIDVLDTTPQQAALLLDAAQGRTLPSLLVGGEAIPVGLWQRLASHFEGTRQGALNVYGPTEATVDATAARIIGDRPVIGTPLANVTCMIADANGMPVPNGMQGELHIGGAGVGRGYMGRPELTAQRFIRTGTGSSAHRWYRSGDLVRCRADGQLEYLGRIDDQAKIRGFRVEPGEVEHALSQINGVKAAAVIVREASGGGSELIAYIVPRDSFDGGAGQLDRLRQTLREVLPDYMLPAHVVVLPSLPLSGSGKLDRSALPEPLQHSASDAVGRAPVTPLERMLAETWGEQLGRKGVRVDQDFFELGGNSILATRLVARLRQLLHAEIPLRMLFECPTIASLIDELYRTGDRARLDEIADTYWIVMEMNAEDVARQLAADAS